MTKRWLIDVELDQTICRKNLVTFDVYLLENLQLWVFVCMCTFLKRIVNICLSFL